MDEQMVDILSMISLPYQKTPLLLYMFDQYYYVF
jgi:hypothetical protein